MRPHFFLTLFLFSFSLSLFSQEEKEKKTSLSKAYISWGYNRSAYSKSDLHIKGEGMDFTIEDAEGRDAPMAFDSKIYLNPLKLTIPQFDFRIGVKVNNKFYVSFGWDHLKYQFINKTYKVSGEITDTLAGPYQREYNGEEVDIPKWLYYHEHTDGLNYIHLSIDYPVTLFETKNSKFFKLELNNEFGTGPVAPWTDAFTFGRSHRTPSIHFAGWGVNLGVKPRFLFFDEHFFIQANFRVGYINLWDVWLYDVARAKQAFTYREMAFVAGYMFTINKKKREALN